VLRTRNLTYRHKRSPVTFININDQSEEQNSMESLMKILCPSFTRFFTNTL